MWPNDQSIMDTNESIDWSSLAITYLGDPAHCLVKKAVPSFGFTECQKPIEVD